MTQSRFDIRPFPRVATYLTGWAGRRTFQQIMGDCTPLAAKLIRKHGVAFQDFPDALLPQAGIRVLPQPIPMCSNFLFRTHYRILHRYL